jgi:radical SAM protein with 4Fe4S-binding SPASM domain
MARRIAATGICRVAISIDGLAPTHDAIRRSPGSFARAIAAVRHLAAEGVPVNVVTHLNRRNLPELDELERVLVGEPVEIWRVQLGAPLGRLRRNPDLVLEPSDLPAVAESVVAARRRGAIRISVGDNIGYFSEHEPELRSHPGGPGYTGALPFWCGCAAGCLAVGIEADGPVKGCLSLLSDELIEGNLRHASLHEIWHRPGAFAYTREFTPDRLAGSCRGCEYGEICRGGCTFMALAATGRPHDNPYCLHRVLSDHRSRPEPRATAARGPRGP